MIADTHVSTLNELPPSLVKAIREEEWVVHCGDYTSVKVVDELQSIAKHFIGVYGNADANDIRRRLPRETILELEGRQIAIIHPYFGGPPDGLEHDLIKRYPNADAILFGHTHDPFTTSIGGILLLNPGQGYSFFNMPVTAGILTVNRQELKGEIISLG